MKFLKTKLQIIFRCGALVGYRALLIAHLVTLDSLRIPRCLKPPSFLRLPGSRRHIAPNVGADVGLSCQP